MNKTLLISSAFLLLPSTLADTDFATNYDVTRRSEYKNGNL